MPDNKLTDVTDNNVGKISDNEIIKALECCNQNDCKTCPYGKYNTAGWCCMPKLRKDTLDLINHLQEENERLKKGWKADVILTANAKAEAYKEFWKELYVQMRMYGQQEKFTKSVFLSVADKVLKELVGEDK